MALMVGRRFAELGGVPGEGEGSDGPDGVARIGTITDRQKAEGTAPPVGKPVDRCGGAGVVMVVRDKATGDYLGSNPLDYLDRDTTEATYPCPVCRPTQFLRWKAGCFRPGHDPDGCTHCVEAGDNKRRTP